MASCEVLQVIFWEWISISCSAQSYLPNSCCTTFSIMMESTAISGTRFIYQSYVLINDGVSYRVIDIDYEHPASQTDAEQGNLDYLKKRIEQASLVISAMVKELRADLI